jgi:Na+-driven multidrug efflux pump
MISLLVSFFIIVLLAILAGYIISFVTADIRIRNIVVLIIILLGLIYLFGGHTINLR